MKIVCYRIVRKSFTMFDGNDVNYKLWNREAVGKCWSFQWNNETKQTKDYIQKYKTRKMKGIQDQILPYRWVIRKNHFSVVWPKNQSKDHKNHNNNYNNKRNNERKERKRKRKLWSKLNYNCIRSRYFELTRAMAVTPSRWISTNFLHILC